MINRVVGVLVITIACMGSAFARAEKTADDPWEPMNRRIFAFNEFVDKKVVKPTARGYQKVTPQPVRTGVKNFFANLGEVPNVINSSLQWRWSNTGNDAARFLINSTLGLLGVFDVASKAGFEPRDTDLGLTFGRWGSGPGPYFVLPLLGPSSVRDGFGAVGDAMMYPVAYINESGARIYLTGLRLVNQRALLLNVEELITGDRYIFLRDLYLQRRQYQISGAIPQDSSDEDEILNGDF